MLRAFFHLFVFEKHVNILGHSLWNKPLSSMARCGPVLRSCLFGCAVNCDIKISFDGVYFSKLRLKQIQSKSAKIDTTDTTGFVVHWPSSKFSLSRHGELKRRLCR